MRGVFKPGYNGSGCSDVHSGIPIGIHDHVAACTGKLETRAKPTMPTPMAGLRGISRINQDDRHASRLRLVRHELPQLVKRPTVVMVALSFADFRALSDAIQVLQGNLSLCGCCGRDELLTDPVVDRSHVTCLSAGEPFQKPFGFFRAFALKRTSDFGIVGTEPLDLCGFVRVLIGIHGHTPSAKINAQRPSWRVGNRGRTFELDMQEERTIASFDQRGTGRGVALKPPFLVVTKRGLKPHAMIEQRQAKGPVPRAEAEDALVIVNRGGLEGRVRSGFDLQCRTHPRNGPNRQVGRQAKAAAHLHVAGMLHFDFVTRMDSTGHVGNEVAGVCKGYKGRIKFGSLLAGWRKFAGYRSYGVHRGPYITYEYHRQKSAKAMESVSSSGDESPTLPRAKAQRLL